jgi:glucokinase
MRAAVVSGDGRIVERRAQPTPSDASCAQALVDLAGGVLDGAGVHVAVIGVPGRVDHSMGRMEHAPNLPHEWAPELTEEHLSAALGVPVSLANDADLAAVGELRFGAGRDALDLVYLTVSTGIGAGVILGGRLVRGRRSIAEAGHTIIDRTSFRDGEPATFEEQASGTGLARLAAGAGIEGGGRAVVEGLATGDPGARWAWKELVEAAAVGATNLAHLFSPEAIVVGGGVVAGAGEALLEPIRRHLSRHGPRSLPEPIRVVGAALGDDAGLAGAAGWRGTALGGSGTDG